MLWYQSHDMWKITLVWHLYYTCAKLLKLMETDLSTLVGYNKIVVWFVAPLAKLLD